jgi:hypothetical protein
MSSLQWVSIVEVELLWWQLVCEAEGAERGYCGRPPVPGLAASFSRLAAETLEIWWEAQEMGGYFWCGDCEESEGWAL